MPSQLTPAEQLMYSTVRVECKLANNTTSTGTAFFFHFPTKGELVIPILVTNKHVIKGAVKGKIHLTQIDPQGLPINGSHKVLEFDDFEQRWIGHPEPETDLAILPIGPILKMLDEQANDRFFRIDLTPKDIPTDDQTKNFTGIEDIIMIGYPNGIWDKVNNLPIIRKGITATHPSFDYNGKKEFIIDAAVFPGSSGSPVFLYNQGTYFDRLGGTTIGIRVFLLGVVYAVFQHTTTGELVATTIPTAQQIVARTKVPNNLGIVIKAQKIMDFKSFFNEAI